MVEALIDPESEAASKMTTFSKFAVDLSCRLEQLRNSAGKPNGNISKEVQTEEAPQSECGDFENCEPQFIAKWLKASNSTQRKQVQEEVLR